jgi:hypothetical protein
MTNPTFQSTEAWQLTQTQSIEAWQYVLACDHCGREIRERYWWSESWKIALCDDCYARKKSATVAVAMTILDYCERERARAISSTRPPFEVRLAEIAVLEATARHRCGYCGNDPGAPCPDCGAFKKSLRTLQQEIAKL